MSDIDDLDEVERQTAISTRGIPLALAKKHLRCCQARMVDSIQENNARKAFFASAKRPEPSLPSIPCLDRPITNYLEDQS